jgi:hypothetical protein
VVYENNAGLCRELNLKDRERWSNDFVLSGLHGGCPWRGGSLSGRSFDWCRGRPIGFEGGDCSLGSNITGNPGASSRTKHNADVEGTVLNTLNQPAQKVAVYIFGLDAFQHLTACTSAKGQYSFRRLAAGRYVTCIVHKETIGLCQDIVLRESQKEKSDFRLATFKQADEEALLKRLPPGAPVSGGLFARVDGKVYDETGAPARGIEVRLERVDKAGNFTTHTDAEGRFSFTAFSGEYVSGVQYKGKHGLLREFTLRAGRTVISDFDLKQFPPD